MERLYQSLKRKGYTIASCESLTAGLFSARLAEVPHVSEVLKGGVVTYWTEIKEDVVGVDKKVVEQYGVVSSQCALEMASKLQALFHVNVAVSFTGNAGPAVLEGKPCGLVYTCIKVNDDIYPFEDTIIMSRNELRNEIINRTVERLLKILG